MFNFMVIKLMIFFKLTQSSLKIRIVIATSNGLDLMIRTVAMQNEKTL